MHIARLVERLLARLAAGGLEPLVLKGPALRRTVYEQPVERHFGDFDLLFGASRLNLRIVDLAVRYHERQYGETNISRFRHGWLLLQMSGFAARKLKCL